MQNFAKVVEKIISRKLTKKEILSFGELCAFLLEVNKTTNLTGFKTPEDVYTKHFIDSISLIPHIKDKSRRLVDIGSGAGFPGLPIAILCPNILVSMIEATGKKSDFTKEAITRLGLNNAKAFWGRAEELAKDNDFAEKFDVATSRAVGRLHLISTYAEPFLKEGGFLLSQKSMDSENIDEEESQIPTNMIIVKSTPITIEGLPNRQILEIKKI